MSAPCIGALRIFFAPRPYPIAIHAHIFCQDPFCDPLPGFFATRLDGRLLRAYRACGNYDAGAMGGRLGLWTPGSPGPNAAILQDLELVRSRSR